MENVSPPLPLEKRSFLPLAWQFTIRAAGWGFILGTFFGGLLGLVLFNPTSLGFPGNLFGAITGTMLGIINGLVLAFVTKRFFKPISASTYRANMLLNTLPVTFLAAILLWAVPAYLITREGSGILICSLPIALIATIGAIYPLGRVVTWYINQSSYFENGR